MNAREQYIQELRSYLTGLSADDQAAAVDFYNEYIEDAGLATVKEIVDRLGTPEQLSQEIIAKTGGQAAENLADQPIDRQNDRRLKKLLLVCLVVVVLLIMIPLIIEIIGLAIAIVASIFGLGVAAVTMATTFFATDAWAAVFYLGGGIALLGALIIALALVIWVGKWVIRGSKNLVKYLQAKFKEVG